MTRTVKSLSGNRGRSQALPCRGDGCDAPPAVWDAGGAEPSSSDSTYRPRRDRTAPKAWRPGHDPEALPGRLGAAILPGGPKDRAPGGQIDTLQAPARIRHGMGETRFRWSLWRSMQSIPVGRGDVAVAARVKVGAAAPARQAREPGAHWLADMPMCLADQQRMEAALAASIDRCSAIKGLVSRPAADRGADATVAINARP